jgi:hypothetical protein
LVGLEFELLGLIGLSGLTVISQNPCTCFMAQRTHDKLTILWGGLEKISTSSLKETN